MLNVYILYRKHIRFLPLRATLEDYQQFSDAVYGVYINVFRQVQKL